MVSTFAHLLGPPPVRPLRAGRAVHKRQAALRHCGALPAHVARRANLHSTEHSMLRAGAQPYIASLLLGHAHVWVSQRQACMP